MAIAALVTSGIGPGSAIKYVITGGLDIGEAVAAPAAVGGGPGFAFVHGPKAHRRRDDIRAEIDALLTERDEVREEIAEEVAEAAAPAEREIDDEPSDVPMLRARLATIEAELRALRARQADIEEEEETLALLLAA